MNENNHAPQQPGLSVPEHVAQQMSAEQKKKILEAQQRQQLEQIAAQKRMIHADFTMRCFESLVKAQCFEVEPLEDGYGEAKVEAVIPQAAQCARLILEECGVFERTRF